MTPEPAITRERAHIMRRDPAADDWPFTSHRDMPEVMKAELDAAVGRAAARIEEAIGRATSV